MTALPRAGRTALSLAALATLFTLLNAVKPLHMDDAAYYYYARHMAEAPLDPYGFTVFWYEAPEPAGQVLAPPVLPYWWAAGIRSFGDHPVAWKLWLLPFSALFVFALFALFRRFAAGLEHQLTWMTVLSPTFLPSLNLMLDVPALALSLTALVLFFAAAERRNWLGSLLAGAVAGVAMQTKYTAFLAPVTMVLYAGITAVPAPGGPWRPTAASLLRGFLAAAVAAGVFVGWECFIARQYPGQGSHFLYHYAENKDTLLVKLADWSGPLFALIGSVAGVTGLLGLVALGCRGWVVAAGGGLILAVLAAAAVLDLNLGVEPGASPFFASREAVPDGVPVEAILFGLLGAGVMATTTRVLVRMLRLPQGSWLPERWRRYRVEWFLAAWLGLELAGYFALTPFGAVRRVMGLVVVGTLILGRLASRTCRRPARRFGVRPVVAANIALGLFFYCIDLREAQARKEAAERTAAYVRASNPDATVWFAGHWGFQFYAERAGMQPVAAGRSRLRRGDWLAVPDRSIVSQSVRVDDSALELVHTVTVADALPWQTVWAFYGTATGAALEHQAGPRVQVRLYRVTASHVPAAP
jgi:4-amino-4-deoxy-L-arabinose transferase-like glycosyltransferase